ncbi:hypothetical protein A0256_18915 [Mucilaginibacter sp. PAMC 26640]|nr:hypothetical protein A0256_18915 [Mucilaginibacter sp. PAMC 26640]
MEQVIPIPTLHLFPVLDKLLVELLASLSEAEWHKPTAAKLWNVKDVAAHLLDGNVRAISSLNNYQNPAPIPQIDSNKDLVAHLNELNASWVNAMKRVSPAWLTEELQRSSERSLKYFQTLDPFSQATFPVAWAGQETSSNWFHIAREYTERWHHQQQIRDAVNKPGIMHRELFFPCMATFVHALPFTYRNVDADEGTLIKFSISGDAGGDWFLQKEKQNWILINSSINQPDASVTLPPDTAWRLFTKGIFPEAAKQTALITGDATLTSPCFNSIAVMA